MITSLYSLLILSQDSNLEHFDADLSIDEQQGRRCTISQGELFFCAL